VSGAVRGAPAPWIEVLASLAQHRVLTSAQVRAMHLPGNRLRWSQRLLARLGRKGLAAHAPALRAQRVWYITERGARAVGEAGMLDGEPRLLDAADAAGPLQAHTIAVNEAAIAFLQAARERGDEFGPLSWRHEVVHPLTRGRGRRRAVLIADAVLTYLRVHGEDVVIEQRFLELDRATLSVERLAAQLGRYATLHRAAGPKGEPLWRSRYPAFPSVICVLAGASTHLLERRRDTATALLRANPELSRTPGLPIRFCLAEELARRGPFAPIFADVRDPARRIDWLGESPKERGR
jgi:protein involved in plasmid replication-relaxation